MFNYGIYIHNMLILITISRLCLLRDAINKYLCKIPVFRVKLSRLRTEVAYMKLGGRSCVSVGEK